MTKLNLANHTPNSENVGIRVDAKSILRQLKGRKEQESADRIACSRLKKYYVGEYKYAVMKN